jgi:hypothetical protein
MKKNSYRDRKEEGQGQVGWTGTGTGGVKKITVRVRWDKEEQGQG